MYVVCRPSWPNNKQCNHLHIEIGHQPVNSGYVFIPVNICFTSITMDVCVQKVQPNSKITNLIQSYLCDFVHE